VLELSAYSKEGKKLKENESTNGNILEKVLKGKTLRVYWWFITNPGLHSGREVQRALGLSSPSLSIYHIDKLKEVGILETNEDGLHSISKQVRVGILSFFVGWGRYQIPRNAFYSLFYTSILLLLPVFFSFHFTPIYIICYVILGVGTTTSWYETIQLWKSQPF